MITMQIPFPRAFVLASTLIGVFVLAWDLSTMDSHQAIPLRLHSIVLVCVILGVMLGTIGVVSRRSGPEATAEALQEAADLTKQAIREAASLRDEVWELNRRLQSHGSGTLAPALDVVSANDPRFDLLRARLSRRDEDVQGCHRVAKRGDAYGAPWHSIHVDLERFSRWSAMECHLTVSCWHS